MPIQCYIFAVLILYKTIETDDTKFWTNHISITLDQTNINTNLYRKSWLGAKNQGDDAKDGVSLVTTGSFFKEYIEIIAIFSKMSY